MAIPVTVPRLGWSMEEGTLLEWLKRDGEMVRPGEMLFVLEGEKAAEEIEALDGGILRIPAAGPKPGDRVKVGQVLAHLVTEGEAAPVAEKPVKAAEKPLSGAALGPAARRAARAMGMKTPSPPIPSASKEYQYPSPALGTGIEVANKPAITPRARRVAQELGIDLSGLCGTGRNGRIRERDVRAATGSTGGRLTPHTPIRQTIAARMVAGVTEAAPVTLHRKVDAANLVNLREQFRKATVSGAVVPSYTDLLVKLTATALRQHPMLQAQWRDDGLFVPEAVNIAVAVDAEAGLFTPVIRNADQRSLREIAGRLRALIEKAQAGWLAADDLRDATFTVSNLGSLGVDTFTPIIPLPQCAVLGIGRIVREPAVVGDAIVPRDQLSVSLTFDHRTVDGAPAARFLDTLRLCVEQPAPYLVS